MRPTELPPGAAAALAMREPLPLGVEWVVDAHGCAPDRLRSEERLVRLFERIVSEVGLHPAAPPAWKVFGGEGGVTGLLLLSESHLACHTVPERGVAAFDLYCCRPRAEWPWEERLAEELGAGRVVVHRLTRGEP
jgi:S-adenosylmethionine decarboxylase